MSNPSPQKLIGISISDNPDLEMLGYGLEHLHELLISVSRTLLRLDDCNIGLVFGGDLRPGGFTHTLFDLAQGESAGQRRLYNYLAWPYYLKLDKRTEAEMINGCYFVRICPEDAGFDTISCDETDDGVRTPDPAMVASRCLTRMRELVTEGRNALLDGTKAVKLTARVIVGGKITGYSSFMPGIFEEFLITRERNIPIYLMGGMGGAAGALAQAILYPGKRNKMQQLQFDYHAEQGGDTFTHLIEAYQQFDPPLPHPKQRYLDLHQELQQLGKDPSRFGNGLSAEENRQLMQSEDGGTIRYLLTKGLKEVCA